MPSHRREPRRPPSSIPRHRMAPAQPALEPRLLRHAPGPHTGESLLLTPSLSGAAEARPGLGRALAAFARRKPLGVIGAAILLALLIAAILGPVLAPFDPYETHVPYKYAGPGTLYEPTGQRFWLGADQLGRDTL